MKLRIIQAGCTSPLYSQAIYHGIAEQMQADDDPVLVIVQPNQSYICIGLHQQLNGEIDTVFCAKNNINIIRRHVGGGTVLLDENQIFFHFIFPKAKAPNQPKLLYPFLLTPVLKTYQDIGITAKLKTFNDIQVANKKIGGTGAGTINNATVLVGSFLYDFNYPLMSQCINAPSENFRQCLQNLLEENITTINEQIIPHYPPSHKTLITQFIKNVELTLNVKTQESALTQREITAIKTAEDELNDDEWLNEEGKKLVEKGLKISSGIYLLETTLTFKHQPLIIRVLYKAKFIDTLWLEFNERYIEYKINISISYNNILMYIVNNESLFSCLISPSDSILPISTAEKKQLARAITDLSHITEY